MINFNILFLSDICSRKFVQRGFFRFLRRFRLPTSFIRRSNSPFESNRRITYSVSSTFYHVQSWSAVIFTVGTRVALNFGQNIMCRYKGSLQHTSFHWCAYATELFYQLRPSIQLSLDFKTLYVLTLLNLLQLDTHPIELPGSANHPMTFAANIGFTSRSLLRAFSIWLSYWLI